MGIAITQNISVLDVAWRLYRVPPTQILKNSSRAQEKTAKPNTRKIISKPAIPQKKESKK